MLCHSANPFSLYNHLVNYLKLYCTAVVDVSPCKAAMSHVKSCALDQVTVTVNWEAEESILTQKDLRQFYAACESVQINKIM